MRQKIERHRDGAECTIKDIRRQTRRRYSAEEKIRIVLVGLHTGNAYMSNMENNAKTSVLYNANCPVCNFEIGHYAQYAGENGLPIRFDDLNTDARTKWGLDADTAARRLYVLHDGTLTSGIPAFLVLWAQMPRYRLLGRIVGLPGIRQIASAAYDHLLAPVIYHWHLRRLRNQKARTSN